MANSNNNSAKPLNVWLWFVGFALLVIVEMGAIALLLPSSGKSSITSAALLAVLTGSAIGIERTIELGWTIVGLTAGAWWPIVNVGSGINSVVASFTTAMQPFYVQAQSLVDKLKDGTATGEQQFQKANDVLTSISGDLAQLGAVGLPQFQVYIGATQTHIDQLRDLVKGVDDLAPIADQTLKVLSSLVGSSTDNPGRRMISLFVGVIFGLPLAAVLGLDIFQLPVDNTTSSAQVTYTLLGVIISGLVIGLGSNPTHEIIKLVQEVKSKYKNQA